MCALSSRLSRRSIPSADSGHPLKSLRSWSTRSTTHGRPAVSSPSMAASRFRGVEGTWLFSHTPPDVARTQKVVLDAEAIERSIRRIAVAITEATSGTKDLALVGIRRGGVALSARIAQ